MRGYLRQAFFEPEEQEQLCGLEEVNTSATKNAVFKNLILK
jgi:hypothetical protein